MSRGTPKQCARDHTLGRNHTLVGSRNTTLTCRPPMPPIRDYVQKGSRIPRGSVGRPGRGRKGDLNHPHQSSQCPRLKPFQMNNIKSKRRTVVPGMKAAEGSTIQGGGTQRWLLKEATFFKCLTTALRMGKRSWPTPTLDAGTPKSTGKVFTFRHEDCDGAPCKYRKKGGNGPSHLLRQLPNTRK